MVVLHSNKLFIFLFCSITLGHNPILIMRLLPKTTKKKCTSHSPNSKNKYISSKTKNSEKAKPHMLLLRMLYYAILLTEPQQMHHQGNALKSHIITFPKQNTWSLFILD